MLNQSQNEKVYVSSGEAEKDGAHCPETQNDSESEIEALK